MYICRCKVVGQDTRRHYVFHDVSLAHNEEAHNFVLFKRSRIAQQTLHVTWELRFVLHSCIRYVGDFDQFDSLSWRNRLFVNSKHVANAQRIGSLLHAIFDSQKYDGVALMTAIKHNHAIDVFRQLHAVDGMEINSVCGTFWVDSRQKAQRYHAALVFVVIIAKCLGQRAAVCSFHVTHRAIWIRDLIYHRMDLLVQIVIEVKRVNLKDPSNIIKHR